MINAPTARGRPSRPCQTTPRTLAWRETRVRGVRTVSALSVATTTRSRHVPRTSATTTPTTTTVVYYLAMGNSWTAPPNTRYTTTTQCSIGWALVNEAENENEKSSIIKLGVRVNPLTVDELTNFEKGKSITTNADRTLKRSMRRNLQRYKLRKENLIEILKANHFITDDTILSENGNSTTFETYRLRAKAAT